MKLGVNVDHVATLRQARRAAEPDPVHAAVVCELAGADVPDGIDGISMVPTLLGRRRQQRKHEALYWEFHEQGKKQAVRMGNYKGIRLNVAKKPDGPIELYNLKNDIGEKNNMADQHPEIVAKIEKLMKSARTPSEHWKMPGE